MFTLPAEIVALLTLVIGFLVTNGLKSLFPNIEITGTAAKITAAIVTCMVALADQGLALVPMEFRELVSTLFNLILAIVGAFGLHYTLKNQKSKPQ